MDRNSPIAQNYLALRALVWDRHSGILNLPRFTAQSAHRQAWAELTAEPPKKRYAPAAGYKGGGSWERLETSPSSTSTQRQRSRDSRAYYCDEWPWRLAGRADEIAKANDCRRSIDHTGWFTDEFQGATIAGYVLRLPHGICVPGIAQSDCDGVTLYPNDLYTDEMEGARAADRYAEIAAKHERDYQRAWRAGTDAAELESEAKQARKEILQICADLKFAKRAMIAGLPAADSIARLCRMARDQVTKHVADIYRARGKRDKLRDDYGSEAAFMEGYGNA